MTDLSTFDHTDALKTILDAIPSTNTGLVEAPVDTTRPYYVLFPLTSPGHDGPLNDPDSDRELIYQVTTVGDGPEMAQDFADIARAALQGATVSVAGRSVWRVEADSTGGVERDDSFQPPLFYVPETFSLVTVPA